MQLCDFDCGFEGWDESSLIAVVIVVMRRVDALCITGSRGVVSSPVEAVEVVCCQRKHTAERCPGDCCCVELMPMAC